MSYFEDLVNRAGRLLGIVTTTGEATIATEATAQTLATEATVSGLATQATAATLGTEATLATRASEATVATLATQATLATRASETTLATRASETTLSTRASEATLATRASEATLATRASEATAAASLAILDSVTQEDALNVNIVGPLSAFGQLVTVTPIPKVQIDAIYGILSSDHETLTSAGGNAVASGSLFTCTTGGSANAYGVLRSRRIIRYRPGQGSHSIFTALYTAGGAANSLQLAGMFTSTDGLFFGYSGTTFGLLRRIAGAATIVRLTITVGASGAENMTVTLNGTPFVVASGGALTTTTTAERIAEVGVFTGWTSTTSPTSNGAVVTFIQSTPAVAGGAFTFTSTGSAAGTFATVQAGAANDDTTGFVPQSSWNVDTMDGTGNAGNPSGVLLNHATLNVFEIVIPYLGAGAILWRIMLPTRRMATVHITQYPNSATVPNQRNPTYRLGWIAESLGSTTALTVKGASAAGFVQGDTASARDPFSSSLLTFTATTSEQPALVFRLRGDFGGTINQREVLPQNAVVGTETANRIVRARVLLNPTLTGTVNWGYVDQTLSCMERATPSAGVTISGGREVGIFITTTAAASLNLSALDLRIEPGDVIVIALTTSAATATCQVSMNWQER